MIKFTKRYTEADNQQAQYDEKSPDEKAANKDDVIKLIEKWIEGSGLEKIVSKPFKINLSELNELVIERDIKQNKSKVADTGVEVRGIERDIWKNAFGEDDASEQPMSDIRDNTKHYLWVTFRADGMVVTVGKTNMSNRDLLKYEDLYSSGTGDTRIILQQLLSPEDKKVLDDLSIRKLRYTQSALVMGLTVNLNDTPPDKPYEVQGGNDKETRTKIKTEIQLKTEKNKLLGAFAIALEHQLGEYLIGEGINILNRYSH
ncbi:hypothetical protein [Brochothrix thermosphacta]|uniref:hypothetical protein n=1 Tax=Brochothrix thermosphacta TaxID=2756 RepID=UPI00083F7F41|nr:hypothetical protein [Brochothrix thermosphacta]ODJ70815.1 hypothetical protein BFR45_11070 [Brochothrix thermosphacta]SOC27799.1 conserved hypothetical protein [Brochothrix thermosphacta]